MNAGQYMRRVSRETQRRGVPWAMFLLGAILIGLAVGCAVLYLRGG